MVKDANNPCLFCNSKISGIAHENELAYATFKQKYRSDEYTDIIFKKITWIKTNTNWKIISEIITNNNVY